VTVPSNLTNTIVVPAQPGFADVDPLRVDRPGGKTCPRLFGYRPIVAWHITVDSDGPLSVVGITSDGGRCDYYMQRPDGSIDDLRDEGTHHDANALATCINERWDEARAAELRAVASEEVAS
jgi:hypothetical protein